MILGSRLRAALGKFSSVLLAEAVGRGLAFAGAIGTARLLGPEGFGELTIALTVLAIAFVVADAGLGESGVQRFTVAERGAESYRSEVAGTRLAASLIATIALVPLSYLLAETTGAPVIVFGACMALPLWMIVSNGIYELRVRQRVRDAAWLNAALGAVPWAGPVLLIVVWPTSPVAACGVLVSSLVLALFTGRLARWRPPTLDGFRSRVRPGLPFLASGVAALLYTRGDRVVAGWVGGPDAAGHYGAAYLLVTSALMAGTAMQMAYAPIALGHVASGTFSMSRVTRHVAILLGLGVIGASACAAFADPIMRVGFGATYADAVPLLRILAALIPLYLVNSYLVMTLVALRLERAVSGISLVNLGLAIPLFGVALVTADVAALAWASVAIEAACALGLAVVLMRSGEARSRAASGSPGGRTSSDVR